MIIQSKRIWIAEQFIPAQIEIEAGKIIGILAYGTKTVDSDYCDERIVPGFIDIHTHGAYGFDTNDANPDGLREWISRLPKEEGTCAVLATTVTQSEEVLINALKNVVDVIEEGYTGAEILGVHFEGPYLNMANKGAQPEEFIIKSNVEQFIEYQDAAKGWIKYITMAAENDQNHALIKHCSKNGVRVSLGHASASYDEVLLAYGNGATCMTHVHNGMPPYHHREPSMAGAAYRLRSMYGEMIGDMNHVHPAIMNNYFTLKGDYAIMVSDSLSAKGCEKGLHMLGGHEFEIRENGSAYLLRTGGLAGSTLRMNIGLKNQVEYCDIPFKTALKSCTINPARMLGIDDRKGEIVVGRDADIVVLTLDYDIIQTYCLGTPQK